MVRNSLKLCLPVLFALFAAGIISSSLNFASRANDENAVNAIRYRENFDSVSTGQLPAGWSTSSTGAGINFTTTADTPDSPPNSAFAPSLPATASSELVSLPILISGPKTVLKFQNRYSLETTWDGAVLEIKIGNGNFEDIIDAGGTFITGGYTTLLNNSTNPLANRFAWSGAIQTPYITTEVLIPASTLGQNVQFRWRLGSNDSFASQGWWIDTVSLENITTGGNISQINIFESGAAFPYPSDITISGLNGLVTEVVVGMENFSHAFPDDVDILLVAPNGRNIVLMSDAGGSFAISNKNLTFLDQAAANLPDDLFIDQEIYKPTNYEAIDTFPSPAPQIQTGSDLGSLFGSDPNGIWSLYVFDDNGLNAGAITGGWNLSIKTSTTGCLPSITPSAQSFPPGGGTGGFQIGMPAGCGWNVSTANPFITIQSQNTGTGSSAINFSVAENTGAARTGLITVSDGFNPRTFQVQQAAGCPTSLGNSNLTFPSIGGSGNVSVTAGAGCIWNASSKALWIQVTSAQQSGSGTATFDVLPNSTSVPRTAVVTIGARSLTVIQSARTSARFDFDGDAKSDISVFRSGTWYLQQSTNGFAAAQFGLISDRITPADFDGDGRTDIAVFRDGTWFVLRSSDSQFFAIQFGSAGDIPVPSDYDGDGRAEIAVFRNGTWFMLNLASNQVSIFQFGLAGDKPVVGDYDGDQKSDLAVFRDGIWFLERSNQGFTAIQFGLAGDAPVAGDFSGDGIYDLAVYRSGTWHILTNFQNYSALQFGLPADLPVPADYDGDGKDDIAVFRDGTWFLLRSTAGFAAAQFGLTGDKPIPHLTSN